MAELGKAGIAPRALNLLGNKKPNGQVEDPEILEVETVPSNPEDAMARFREMGNMARESGAVPLDAHKIAMALRTVSVPLAPTRGSNEIVNRSIQIPGPIFEASVGVVGGDPRKFPSFVRDAVKAIAEGRVAPRKLMDQAAEISRARKAGIGIIKRTVEMPKVLFDTVEILSQRTKMSPKAVIEACVVLYLQAILVSSKPSVQEA